jgi:hypothetical protein
MRFWACLSLCVALQAPLAGAQGRVREARCWKACDRVLVGVPSRFTLCQACITDLHNGGGWVPRVKEIPPAAALDPDWQVRWALARREGLERGLSPIRVLALRVSTATDTELSMSCLTAAYAAGLSDLGLAEILDTARTQGPAVAERCTAIAATLRQRAAEDLASPESALRADALRLAARGLEVSAVRLVLDALPHVSTTIADALARQLVALAREQDRALGRDLLSAAGPQDKPAVDLLLAVFSELRDTQRPLLAAPALAARKEAVRSLAPLAPLSESELRVAFDDASPLIRKLAASAIAKGEGRSLAEAVHVRIEGSVEAAPQERLKWLQILGGDGDASCTQLTRGLWRDATQADTIRAEALTALAGCAKAEAWPELEEAFAQRNVLYQSAAVRGAAQMPRDPRSAAMLLKAVDSEDAPTLEAALPVLGVLGLRSVAPRVLALVRHPSQSVRRAALGALPFLDPAGAEEVARAALGSDVEPSVRAAAAQVLGDVGTARSASALNRAAREDPDSRVKFVAGDSLRKLGFHVPSRSPNP